MSHMARDGITAGSRRRQPPRPILVIGITEKRCSRSHGKSAPSAKLDHRMNDFGVLNNRKRALIALIHSVVFLGIATHGFLSPKAGVLHGQGGTGDFILIAIYVVVASILAWLVSLSRCARERIYFAFCASSATFGLLRSIFGDPALPAAQYLARDHA